MSQPADWSSPEGRAAARQRRSTEAARVAYPCPECGGTDIEAWDYGYASFNPGGGRCLSCGHEEQGEAGCLPSVADLMEIWNRGAAKRHSRDAALLRETA